MSRRGSMFAAVMAASVVAFSGSAFAQAKVVDGPEVRWKLAAWGKPRAATQNIETLRKFMDERTGGKFKIQIGYESFGQPKELLDLLKVGSLEMTNICASYHPEKLPVYSALDLPFLPIQDTSVQEKVHLAFHNHPLVLKEFASWNAIPYLSALLPNNEFVGRGKAPKTVDDFKGMRVRALAGIGAAMRKIGAVPTSVDATEVYTSLERGTVDAAAFPSTYAHQSYRTYEVGKWYTANMALGSVGCPTLIHVDRWNSLPPQYKALFEEARPLAHAAVKKAYAEADDKNIPLFKKKLEFLTYSASDLAAFRKAGGEPVWEEWVKLRESQGIPGRELLNFLLTQAGAGPKS
ncbi:MAG: C4-dicarboxylate ABC transporter substrate-binding protein [Alphaproteobacteria bacterium]|nr:C4-dicarboxylate ABC transporter substrate-binding protein [Alphaproteobacteria bacterium]